MNSPQARLQFLATQLNDAHVAAKMLSHSELSAVRAAQSLGGVLAALELCYNAQQISRVAVEEYKQLVLVADYARRKGDVQ